ncbi:hypothetical protein ACHAWC_008322 [Mediolabrus comicus]
MANLRGLDTHRPRKNMNFQNVLAALQQASTSTTNWTEVAAAASECESHAFTTFFHLGRVINAATQGDKNEVILWTNQAAVSASAARLAAKTAKHLASGSTSEEERSETTDDEDDNVVSSLIKVDGGVSNFDSVIYHAHRARADAWDLEKAAAKAVDAATKAAQDAKEKVNALVPLSYNLLNKMGALSNAVYNAKEL